MQYCTAQYYYRAESPRLRIRRAARLDHHKFVRRVPHLACAARPARSRTALSRHSQAYLVSSAGAPQPRFPLYFIFILYACPSQGSVYTLYVILYACRSQGSPTLYFVLYTILYACRSQGSPTLYFILYTSCLPQPRLPAAVVAAAVAAVAVAAVVK